MGKLIFLIQVIIFYLTFTGQQLLSNEINDHRISVLVNDEVITSYDIIQRTKMNAIVNGVTITPENKQAFVNSIVDELIGEKLKNEKFIEYNVNVTIDEIRNYENDFYSRKEISKEDLFKIFADNNILYKNLEDYFITEISWQKLIAGLYYRLTSASEIEINNLISKNPSINYEQAKNEIVQRQLDLKSNKLLRDMFNEATIEFR